MEMWRSHFLLCLHFFFEYFCTEHKGERRAHNRKKSCHSHLKISMKWAPFYLSLLGIISVFLWWQNEFWFLITWSILVPLFQLLIGLMMIKWNEKQRNSNDDWRAKENGKLWKKSNRKKKCWFKIKINANNNEM